MTFVEDHVSGASSERMPDFDQDGLLTSLVRLGVKRKDLIEVFGFKRRRVENKIRDVLPHDAGSRRPTSLRHFLSSPLGLLEAYLFVSAYIREAGEEGFRTIQPVAYVNAYETLCYFSHGGIPVHVSGYVAFLILEDLLKVDSCLDVFKCANCQEEFVALSVEHTGKTAGCPHCYFGHSSEPSSSRGSDNVLRISDFDRDRCDSTLTAGGRSDD